jgi:signal transduction histidine kinase
MRSRSSSLRTKVVALLVSLGALWAFAAWVTLREGLNLLWVQTYDSQVYQPSEPLLQELQLERRLSVTYLAEPGSRQRAELDTSRQRTEQLTAEFKRSARSWQADLAGSDELDERVRDVVSALDALAGTRSSIDARAIDRAGAADAFTTVVDSIFGVYAALGALDDQQVARDTANLIQLNRSRELMSQEDALVTGALTAGRFTEGEYARFTQLIGAQRFLATDAVGGLPDADRTNYEQTVAGGAFTRFRSLEDRLVQGGRPGQNPPVSATDWRQATEPALAELQRVVVTGGDAVVDRATPIALAVVLRVVLAGGLGLIAVIASIVVSITTARALVRQLERLREAAGQLAHERLPGVVSRLGRGEAVDVAAEAPPLEFGDDEIGQVGQAFNDVQETAIRTAVEQAELRRTVRDVFLSLARRTQALVHRQLSLLDAMERRENDAEELEDLFRVDHLATRMRRNAENLIVLSGATPGRAWRRNVPMVDVVRGAVAEVEDFTRVTVLPLAPVGLAGRAVGDVIHLLAELIENALSFSPPNTGVEVRGQQVANGFVIEIEDRGLGMSAEELADANRRIVDRSEFNLADAARLGLFVVSRLTERHGIRVNLKESPYGGTTAVVLVPQNLVTDSEETPEVTSGAVRRHPAVATLGRQMGGTSAAGTSSALYRSTTAGTRPNTARPATTAPPVTAGPPPARPPVSASALPSSATAELPTVSPPHGGAAQPPSAGHPGRGERPAETTRPSTPPPTGGPAAASEGGRTASGLPMRVRQANLAPALRKDPAAEPQTTTADDEVHRQPEKIRRMMSAYQTGTLRGRTDAARLGEGGGPPGPDGPPPGPQGGPVG